MGEEGSDLRVVPVILLPDGGRPGRDGSSPGGRIPSRSRRFRSRFSGDSLSNAARPKPIGHGLHARPREAWSWRTPVGTGRAGTEGPRAGVRHGTESPDNGHGRGSSHAATDPSPCEVAGGVRKLAHRLHRRPFVPEFHS